MITNFKLFENTNDWSEIGIGDYVTVKMVVGTAANIENYLHDKIGVVKKISPNEPKYLVEFEKDFS